MLFLKPNVDKMKQKRNTKGLIKALKYKDSDIRLGAATVLEEFGWQPKTEDEKEAYLLAKKDFNKLSKLGKSAVKLLWKILRDDNNPQVRSGAAYAFGEIGEIGPVYGSCDIVEFLSGRLEHETECNVCLSIVEAMRKIGNQSAINALVSRAHVTLMKGTVFYSLSSKKDIKVSEAAVSALQTLGKNGLAALAAAKMSLDSLEKDLKNNRRDY